jgi:cytoskeleton protein RodZ
MTSQKELIPLLPGDILRYEREKKGLTLERAAERSKIKLPVLSAIESGETGEIPSVYLHGYIRSYAHFLGLDSRNLDQHMEHVKGSEPEIRSVFDVNTKRKDSDRWLKASSYLAASALIATLAWQFTHEAVRFSQGDSRLNSPTANSAEQDAGSAAEPGRPAKRHLNASIASIEVLKQQSKNGARSTAEQAWAAIDGKAGLSGDPSSGFQTLQVSTSADTWVEIEDAVGLQIEMDLIRAGESRNYSGKSPFRVLLGRASAVEVRLDDQLVDLAPHTRGNVARMSLGGQSTAAAADTTGAQAETVNR